MLAGGIRSKIISILKEVGAVSVSLSEYDDSEPMDLEPGHLADLLSRLKTAYSFSCDIELDVANPTPMQLDGALRKARAKDLVTRGDG